MILMAFFFIDLKKKEIQGRMRNFCFKKNEISIRRYIMDTLFSKSSAISIVKKGKTGRMKSIFLLKIFSSVVILLMAIGFQKSYGQGVGISETSIVPHASSILELRYTSGSFKGFLAPRLTTVQRTGIGSPAAGLLVYDTNTKSFWYWDGGWKAVAATGLGTANQLLGMNAGSPLANEYKTLFGTLNQINVDLAVAGEITLSTPQNIHIGATPEFVGLTLSGLTANSGVYTDGSSVLTSTPPTSGTIGYWDRTGTVLSPVTLGDDITTTGGLNADGVVTLASTGVATTVEGALDVDEAANFDGNVDANAGLDVTGAALTVDNQAITQTTGGQVTFAGNVDAGAGVDVTGLLQADDNVTLGSDNIDVLVVNATADFKDVVNVDGNLDANAGIDVTSGDLNVTDNLNVTTDATITGNTRVDGTFRFDAAGNPVDNIRTDVRATGFTDDVSLVTESAIE
jgi:hypothetical protein